MWGRRIGLEVDGAAREREREESETLLLIDPSMAETSVLTTKEIMHFSILAWTPISIV